MILKKYGGSNLKKSIYNIIFKDDEGCKIIYNTKSLTFKKLSEAEAVRYESGCLLNENSEIVTELKGDGFLCPDDFDEVEDIKLNVLKECENADTLSLGIAPTMDCQFACRYCFEKRRHGIMDEKVQELVVNFVKKSFEKYHHKSLRVHWYGGEPLLGINVIESLSHSFMEITKEYNAKYNAFIVTNGYLLNQKTAKSLEECGVEYAVVTVDGIGDIHDKSRVLHNGKGTFTVIEKNLNELDADMDIYVKMNIHKGNAMYHDEMKAFVEKLNKGKTRFYFSRSFVNCGNPMIDGGDYFDTFTQAEYEEYLNSHPDTGSLKRENPKAACNINREFYFAIDELGNIYKCGDCIGKEEAVITSLFSYGPDKDEYIDSAELDFARKNKFPEDDEECLSCVMFPQCLGSCPKARVLHKQKVCLIGKNNPEEYARRQYRFAQKTLEDE